MNTITLKGMPRSQGAKQGFAICELRVVFGKLRIEVTTFVGIWESTFFDD